MISLKDIQKAQKTIEPYIKKTDVLKINKLSNLTNMNIYLKLENLQSSGSFKIRGACNKIASLSKEEIANGIICASAGNHAQGVAYGANIFNSHATIVMPKTAPITKVKSTLDLGAEVFLEGDIFDDSYEVARRISEETNKTFIHAFDDDYVIAGQGTIGLELLEQVENLDVVIVPVGGGGLISGIAIAIKSINPDVKIIGVQASNAPNMKRSFDQKNLLIEPIQSSIADGIAVKFPGKKTFEIIKQYVDEIVTVTEDEIAHGILYLLETCRIVSEGSGAASVAAILSGKVNFPNKNVVALITGGNVDVNLIEAVINRGLIATDRRFELKTVIYDRPGELQKLLATISNFNGNIFALEQRRFDNSININQQQVTLVIGCYGPEHKEQIISELRKNGYRCH